MNRKFTYLVIFKYKISEFSINMQKLLYSYWDTEGKGINLTYLTTYSDKLIFDSYNRSFFTEGKTFGNHFIGSYHGEVFNDFEHNSAYADYSSVHGHHNVVQNESEAAFGKYNNSTKGKTIFSVGYGNESSRSNIFELQNTGVAYVKDDIYSGSISFKDTYSYLKNAYSYNLTYSQNIGNKLDNTYSYLYNSYSYTLGYVNNLANRYDGAYTYLRNSYAYTLGYTSNLGHKIDSTYSYLRNSYTYTLGYANSLGHKYDSTYSYLRNSYSYTLGYVNNLANRYDSAYSYFENAYSYIYKNYPSVIPNSNYSKLYIWAGTSSELPPVENRFKNVIYIVTNEQETELPEYKG